jgi:hypothetical protein
MTTRTYRNPRPQKAARKLLGPESSSFAPRPARRSRLRKLLQKAVGFLASLI